MDAIAEALEAEPGQIRKIMEAAGAFAPEYDPMRIYEAVTEQKVLEE